MGPLGEEDPSTKEYQAVLQVRKALKAFASNKFRLEDVRA